MFKVSKKVQASNRRFAVGCVVVGFGFLVAILGLMTAGGAFVEKPTEPQGEDATQIKQTKTTDARKTFGYNLKEWKIKVKATGMDRDLPPLTEANKMACQVRCAATFAQGKHVFYTVGADTIDGDITDVIMVISSDGSAASGIKGLLSMVTFAQAMAAPAPENQVSAEITHLLENLSDGVSRQATIGGVKFTLTTPKGLGIWLGAEPASL